MDHGNRVFGSPPSLSVITRPRNVLLILKPRRAGSLQETTMRIQPESPVTFS